MIDLHAHSHYSADAESSPVAIIEAALQAGVRLLSITDHNGIDHIEPTLNAAHGKSIRLLPGLELTCACPEFGMDEIHILAHFPKVDDSRWRHPALRTLLEKTTTTQAQNLVSLLDGLEIPRDSLERARQSLMASGRLAAATRPALHLFKRCEKNLSPFPWAEMKIKRDLVIARLRKRGQWHPFPTVAYVLQVLTTIGATPTLAHPGRYGLDSAALSALIDRLTGEGLQGLEAIYLPQLASSGIFIHMAKTKGCFITSGSDSHSIDSMLRPNYHQFIDSVVAIAESSNSQVKWTDNL